MRCEDVAEHLPGVADGTVTLAEPARHHVEHCLRCQAELVQYRKLLRALRSLRSEVLEPAPGLLADVLVGLSDASERHVIRQLLSGRRVAYVGGIAAATAAGAAGALVLVGRSRKGRFRLAS